ncbi:HPr family phosphocarrier protein [bacterium]|nr:HPr family phosphocarrier protein [bacterium]
MFVIETEVINKLGLHARPATLLVQTATQYAASVHLERDDEKVDGKSIIEVLTLAAEMGSIIRIIANGDDEKEAAQAIEKLFKDKFGED